MSNRQAIGVFFLRSVVSDLFQAYAVKHPPLRMVMLPIVWSKKIPLPVSGKRDGCGFKGLCRPLKAHLFF